MTKIVPATYARRHLNEILDRVYRTNEPLIITLRGKPVAAIINPVDLQKLHKLRGQTLKIPRYPDVASVAGAGGSLKRRVSWRRMREIAYEDAFLHEYKKAKGTSRGEQETKG